MQPELIWLLNSYGPKPTKGGPAWWRGNEQPAPFQRVGVNRLRTSVSFQTRGSELTASVTSSAQTRGPRIRPRAVGSQSVSGAACARLLFETRTDGRTVRTSDARSAVDIKTKTQSGISLEGKAWPIKLP